MSVSEVPNNVADDAADDVGAFDIAGDEADTPRTPRVAPVAEEKGDGAAGGEEGDNEDDPFASAAAMNVARGGLRVESEEEIVEHVMRVKEGGAEKVITVAEPARLSSQAVKAEQEKDDAESAEEKQALDEAFEGADKVVYTSVQHLLESHHLGLFILQFHNNGVNTLDALKGCSDTFLTETIGMKPAHRVKFHRALKDAHIESLANTVSLYEAPDGARFFDLFLCFSPFMFSPFSNPSCFGVPTQRARQAFGVLTLRCWSMKRSSVSSREMAVIATLCTRQETDSVERA